MSYERLFDLTDKVALVAGAAGGLAFETCLGLSQFGARSLSCKMRSNRPVECKWHDSESD
jgi:NAD(P)-dependent dehydrogenase (short-subunit alcohol dehydrogenase family)